MEQDARLACPWADSKDNGLNAFEYFELIGLRGVYNG
jgi:hypothetical protein